MNKEYSHNPTTGERQRDVGKDEELHRMNLVLGAQVANGHPRILCTEGDKTRLKESVNEVDWKEEIIAEKKQNVDRYLAFCEENPDWLVSRLQMYWKSKSTDIFVDGGDYSHASGTAPVPTVRFSGSRDWSTEYRTPALEEIEPYFDDKRGMYLTHKEKKIKEWVHPSKTGHIIEGINRRIMSIAKDAAFLYWWTGEVKYARLAEPVFTTYITGMYYRNAPEDISHSAQQRLSGLATFEVIHEKIIEHLTVTYDFLYPYLEQKNEDLDKISSVFQAWGDQIIKNGVADNNWNFFQARFITYIALALDENENYQNGKGREYFLDHTFKTSTERQTALNEAILEYDQETGFWFESANYSLHVTSTLLEIVSLLDNLTDRNELMKYDIIEKAAFSGFQYLFPSGYTVAFGDGRHNLIPPKIFELLISNYRKYNRTNKEIVITKILKNMIDAGQYNRNGDSLFEFFFYVDSLKSVQSDKNLLDSLLSPTVYAPNVSYFAQRIGRGDDAMMVATTGSFGNHAHSNGISIELYANNYVLGPDMSHGPSYWHPDYRNYYSQFPAHNTVVVDGVSSSGRMRAYHPFTLRNYFPELNRKISQFDKITFSNVTFVEPKTLSDQQRLTAQILSDSGKGYIIDIFRSRKQFSEPQKHEYFYHNLGQSLDIYDNDQLLKLNSTNELASEHGDMKAYDYLSDKYHRKTSDDVQAVFTLKEETERDNLMKMWVKGSPEQGIFTALSPRSDALSEGTAPHEMIDRKIPTLILRREQEAWTDPFAVVFNPYFANRENPIYNVEFSNLSSNPSSQKINVTFSDGKVSDEIISNTSVDDMVSDDTFYQKGLLSIVRSSTELDEPAFIFVAGMYRFQYRDWEILTKNEAVTLSIELTDAGYELQNSEPVVLRIPINQKDKINFMELYDGNRLLERRRGFISRSNPDQLEFRLSQSYEMVKLVKE